ncbi:MAG: DUF4625 domain-containing protein [Proteiniphilum sp.]|nr:DUF4625 domain-containing protein [Proteiniphilum sp.]
MKTRNIAITLLLAAVIALTSCEKEVTDNEKPVIVLTAPVEDEAVLPGSDIHLEVTLSDNEALASYKVNIHGAFDGHKHSATTRATEDSVAFEKTLMESDFIALGEELIAGKRSVTIHHHLIEIPETVNGKPLKEGHYHFIIYCTDQAGQESFIAREILISYDAEEYLH